MLKRNLTGFISYFISDYAYLIFWRKDLLEAFAGMKYTILGKVKRLPFEEDKRTWLNRL